jgi:hypothetical protein
MAALYGKVFDQATKVPWFAYHDGATWRQVWYDDSASLAMKYGLVNARNLGGIGIWALSYDGGRPEIWNGIKSAFTPTGVETVVGEAPQRLELLQNYPNPLNPSTTISYQLPDQSTVSLQIFNALGQPVATLAEGEKEAGFHKVRWNANVPSGIYFYRLSVRTEGRNGQVGQYVETRAMTVLK